MNLFRRQYRALLMVVAAAVVGAVGLSGCDDNTTGGGGGDNPGGSGGGSGSDNVNWTIKPGSFTDKRDGKSYKTVEMPDGRTWMAENLNFATESGSWCYDNKESNCGIYGRLYDWDAWSVTPPLGGRLMVATTDTMIVITLASGT